MIRSCVSTLCVLACVSLSLAHGQRPIPPGAGGDANWANQHLGHWRPDQPDFGFEFATIGNPGNRAVAKHEMEGSFGDFTGTFTSFGRVDYAYRISTTEVTASQWLPFARAFRPFYESDGSNFFTSALVTDHMRLRGFNDIEVIPGEERMAMRTQMMFAMRYANWLHHGAPTGPEVSREVFETGAYDLDRQYTFDAPPQRNEDARFWIPSWDEWTKAAYYDPDRYGEGEEGYWTYTDGRDTLATPGLPWQGGETNAGWDAFPELLKTGLIPVAAYEDSQSPWGLYDTSGGEREWTDQGANLGDQFFDAWYVRGSGYLMGTGPQQYNDAVDGFFEHVSFIAVGLRIASIVPSPSALSVLLGGCVLVSRRRA